MRALLLLFLLGACAAPSPAPPEPQRQLVADDFTRLPGAEADALTGLAAALGNNCAVLQRRTATTPMGAGLGLVGPWQEACASLPAGDDLAHLRRWLADHFQVWRVQDGADPAGLFTGYYEPLVRGSLLQTGPYQTPLYARPDDLVMVELGDFRPALAGQRLAGFVAADGRLRPYADRATIMRQGLGERAVPLVFLDDPVAAFFLEIQGSGIVQLPDGTQRRIGYAAQNGHPYVPIGRVLVERGLLDRQAVSMQSIRAWLDAHPGAVSELLAQNPSVVFFRWTDAEAAIGAMGVGLTPGRSLAVDPRFIPYGAILYVDIDGLAGAPPIRRFVVAQDTGGAIRGVVRGDLFWGHGPDAAWQAGQMRQTGRYWLLLPHGVLPDEKAGK